MQFRKINHSRKKGLLILEYILPGPGSLDLIMLANCYYCYVYSGEFVEFLVIISTYC